MKCPFCGDQESKVVDSRRSEDFQSIRRRRECLHCQRRFTTYEMVESLPIIVIKRQYATAIVMRWRYRVRFFCFPAFPAQSAAAGASPAVQSVQPLRCRRVKAIWQ